MVGFPTKQPDGEPDTLWWGGGMPSDRHNRGCNFSYADGHVATKRWRAPKRGMPEGDVQAPSDPDDALDLRDLRATVPRP
jgi:prepilin-type processing-associated H-X9-DG protein